MGANKAATNKITDFNKYLKHIYFPIIKKITYLKKKSENWTKLICYLVDKVLIVAIEQK